MGNKAPKAYLYAGLSILLWSTVASAFKIALRYVDFVTLLLISSYTSLIVFALLLIAQGKTKEFLKQNRRDFLRSALFGFLNPFLYYLILFKAYSLLPAQLAQPLNFTWPLVLVIFSMIFFKEKVRWQVLGALLISFLGVIFISSEGRWFSLNFNEPLGIALALSSSIIWASYWLVNKNDKRDAIVKLFSNFFFASIFISIVFVLTIEIELPNRNGLISSIYVGLFEMGITFVFWMKALEYAKNTQFISNLIYVTPFLSLLLISLVLKEHIYTSSVVGLGMIALGILIQEKIKQRQ